MAATKSRDACVVPAEQLGGVIRGFVTKWNRDRPSRHDVDPDLGRVEVQVYGAVAWLAQESGVPEGTIFNIVADPPRHRNTELHIVDALVGALERPELFHDGTLVIMPNPLAKRSVRATCCGGSLTGDASRD